MANIIQTLIDRYQLQAHPEGGYFCETYRSSIALHSSVVDDTRDAVTHIYFLLTAGQVSRFHKVMHDEIWNFYAGAPLSLKNYHGDTLIETTIGNHDLSSATLNDYSTVIPAGTWQAAESTGEFSLVGCSVAPGFDFADFSFMDDEKKSTFLNRFPQYSRFL